jgi:hypothetical protein
LNELVEALGALSTTERFEITERATLLRDQHEDGTAWGDAWAEVYGLIAHSAWLANQRERRKVSPRVLQAQFSA